MSVKIIRKVYTDDEESTEEEIFEIYKTDSLETIKTRYFIKHEIFPRLANFTIKSQDPFGSSTKKLERSVKIYNKLNKSKFELLKYNLIEDVEWEINPLENSEIYVETFRDFISRFTDINFSVTKDFMDFIISISVQCQELFSMNSIEEIVFYIALTYYSDIEKEESYEDSLKNIEDMIYDEDFSTFALSKFFDDRLIRNRYKELWDLKKEEVNRDKEKGGIEQQIIDNTHLGHYLSQLDQLGLVSSEHNILSLFNKKKEINPIRTPLIETDYMYIGECDMEIDAYELFNKLSPTHILPFLNIGKFYKLLNNFNFPDKWIEEFELESETNFLEDDESTLYLFVYGKKDTVDASLEDPEPKDYFMIKMMQKGQVQDKFPFEITIKANKQIQLTQDEIIERCLNLITLNDESNNIQPQNLTLRKIFGNGFFVIKNVDLKREIFFDNATTHEFMSKVIIIDESYKIIKERGGIKFFATMNNLESKIKASLVYKQIQKPTDDEIEAYPGLVQMKDRLMVFKISQAENKSELMKLINIITGAIVFMLQHTEDFFAYYSNFIKDIGKINIVQMEEEEELKLKDVYPKIFMSGYARDVCQDPPKIMFDKKEIERELKNPNTDIFLFPKPVGVGKESAVSESAYYTCSHNRNKKFVGLIKNKLPNKDKYPFLPCCFVKDHKKPKKIRFSYENEDKIVESEKGFNQVVSTQKIIKQDQYAFLPENISDLFNIIDQNALLGVDRYMRLGIPQAPYSVIYCILKALGEQLEKETIKKIRTQIYNLAEYNFASQQELQVDDIKRVILNNETIDVMYFYPILENIFKVNIIILCKDRGELIDGGLCPAAYKLFYITDTTKILYENTVIIFRTFGGEFDKLKYPHHELIVKEKGFTETNKIKGKIETSFKSNSSFISHLNAVQLSTMNFKAIALKFKSSVVKQINDGNGKIRIIHLLFGEETINLITSPIANFDKDRFVQPTEKWKELQKNIVKLKEVNFKTALDFFKYELYDEQSVRKVVSQNGYVIGMFAVKDGIQLYIPVVATESKEDGLQIYDLSMNEYLAPSTLSFSLVKQYNTFLKLSNFITSNCLFLFSNLFNERLKKFYFRNSSDTFEEDINELIDEFSDNIEVEDRSVTVEEFYGELNRNLFLTAENIIAHEERLIVPSNNIKKKLLYVVYINIKYNLNGLIDYKWKKYVEDFYTTPKDFMISDEYNIFFTIKELMFTKRRERWDASVRYTVYSDIPISEDGKYSQHLFFQNEGVLDNRLLIAQQCKSINHALFVSQEWNTSKINKVRYTGEIEEKECNYLLYYKSGEGYEVAEIINNEMDSNFKLILVCQPIEEDDTRQGDLYLMNIRERSKPIYYSLLPYEN